MGEIIEYGIVETENNVEMRKMVNLAIKEGWQPYGNLVISYNIYGPFGMKKAMPGHVYTQVLVKYK